LLAGSGSRVIFDLNCCSRPSAGGRNCPFVRTHLASFAKRRERVYYNATFGIEAHGFWTAKEDVEPRLFMLASYAAGEEPGEVARQYMQSKEFAEDIRNFDVSDIVSVESTILVPSTSSLLK
jgi:hypothetical protein